MKRVAIALGVNINFIVTPGLHKGWWPNMEFHEGCLNIAKRSWELNVNYPVILGFQKGQLTMIEFSDDVDNEESLIQFVRDISCDDSWDALAIISEVWFDMITVGRPIQLSEKNPDAQDGLAVALITRNRSYVSLAHIKNGELGDFAPRRIMAGGRYHDIKLGDKLKKAV